MRKLIAASTAVLLAAVLATTAFAATRSIKVGDNYFVRSSGVPTVTVKKGTRVRWKFSGSSSHNVSVKSGPVKFNSPVKSSGVFSKKVTRKGTYTIICTIHGEADQKMILKVK